MSMVHHIQNNMKQLISMLSTILNSMEHTLNIMLSEKKENDAILQENKTQINICSFVKRKA